MEMVSNRYNHVLIMGLLLPQVLTGERGQVRQTERDNSRTSRLPDCIM